MDQQPQSGLTIVSEPALKPYGRPLAEILADLARPLPSRFLSQRRQGGNTIPYLSWYNANKLMDYFCGGGWEGSVTSLSCTQTEVFVVYRVIIHSAEGAFGREATGSERLDNNSWGEAIAKAESQAFRRACARWGLALYLYE